MPNSRTAMTITPNALITAAQNSKAWPFQEAQRLAKRLPEGKPGGVLFETGYGPSGLPHIGTFQEVLRTTLVRRAYEALTGGAPTRLVAFSDDMDGLRKVPDNVPNREMLAQHMGKPLSRIPNPFGTEYESFAAHNNAMLRAFLDQFGFQYEFVSSSDCYNNGQFDAALKGVLANFGAIMDIMLPTLGEERRQTYSPVMPISPTTGAVLQVPIDVVDAAAGIIRFTDEDGAVVEQSALGGMAKCQWKVDWAMRWVALGVDYEMYGKDLTDSGIQSGKIARVLGGNKPEGLIYELFLDAKGEKISKSKGNGLSIEDWLQYGSEESLGNYIFANPKSAKQLHAGVIPKAIDDYWQFRAALPGQEIDKQLGNPVWHLLRANESHAGAEAPGAGDTLPVPFSLLLNLVGVLGAEVSEERVLTYLRHYIDMQSDVPFDAGYSDEQNSEIAERYDNWLVSAFERISPLIPRAIAYHRDVLSRDIKKRAPTSNEAAALGALSNALENVDFDISAEDLQTLVYEIGKIEEFGFENLRDWFKALYETLLGSEQGPRMGSFIALYGIAPTRELIAEALAKA
jgi:lysyl-tRNA synthetase, class I